MKLTKLADLQNRVPNLVELSSRYLFGGNYPMEFSPTKHYHVGDYVYVNIDGRLHVYLCTIDGVYSDVHSNGWISADIPSIVNHFYHKNHSVEEMVVINNDLFDYLYISDCIVRGREIVFESQVENLYHLYYNEYELFINGARLSNDLYDCTFGSSGIITMLDDTVSLDGDILLVNKVGLVPESKLIRTNECHPSYMVYGDNELVDTTSDTAPFLVDNAPFGAMIVEVDEIVTINSSAIKIFINGRLLPNDYYVVTHEHSSTTYIIKFTQLIPAYMGIGTETLVLNGISVLFTYSLSPMLKITSIDTNYPINRDLDTHVLDVYTNTSIRVDNCRFETYSNGLRKNGENVIINGSNTIAFTLSPQDSVKIGDNVTTHVTQIAMNWDNNDNVVVTQVVDPNRIQIPFYNYTSNTTDFLLFKKDGRYVNFYKYHVGYMNELVPCDSWVSPNVFISGESISFHKISSNNTNSLQHVVHIVRADETTTGFRLPFTVGNYDQIMVFKGDGVHVCTKEYTIDNNMYVPNEPLTNGLILEFVIIHYDNEITSSITCKVPGVVMNDAIVKLELAEYNNDTDHIMIFREDGTYLYDDYYCIDNRHVVLANSNIRFNEGELLDIYITRSLKDSWVFVENIDDVILSMMGL